MIRHIALLRLKAGTQPEQVEALRQAMTEAQFPGRASFWMASDAGLRPGNMDVVMMSDFADEAAYQAFDVDPHHALIRQQLVAPITEEVARCQVRI